MIISYLYDPDRIFENNLRRCGVENLLCGPSRIVEKAGHAACHLALPIEEMGIRVVDLTEKVFPSIEDRQFASEFVRSLQQPVIAIPRNKNVRVLVAPSGRLSDLEITRVEAAITAALRDWSVEAGSEC